MNNEDLSKEIEQLKKEKEFLSEQSKRKTYIFSAISHEIKNPITAIIGMTNLLLEENPTESQLQILKTMKFSADNLLKFLNTFLDYSKIESGKFELEETEFNLFEFLLNIKQMYIEVSRQKNLELELKVDSNIPTIVKADSLRLSQILTNLISNAIKFTKEGCIIIETKLISRKANLAEIEFSVKDTGIGIQKENIDSIFDLFNQGETTISRQFGGTGLGLTIIKRILELMDSKIKVESEINQGSRFYFSLFLTTPMQMTNRIPIPAAQVASSTEKTLKGVKLLLVEDNISNQKVTLRYLQKWEIEADIADNGLICLEKLQQNTYDIILMDLQMPELDGYEASKRIREKEDPYFKEMPIIALTASSLMDTGDLVKNAGMNDYIAKPFSPNELFNIIEKYTRK